MLCWKSLRNNGGCAVSCVCCWRANHDKSGFIREIWERRGSSHKMPTAAVGPRRWLDEKRATETETAHCCTVAILGDPGRPKKVLEQHDWLRGSSPAVGWVSMAVVCAKGDFCPKFKADQRPVISRQRSPEAQSGPEPEAEVGASHTHPIHAMPGR